MGYFKRKEELKKLAKEHTNLMEAMCKNDIDRIIAASVIYGGNGKTPVSHNTDHLPVTVFRNWDTVTAIIKACAQYKDKKIAALNFASYKNPGGMFMGGSSAQEESLCHSSFLYNVLSGLPDYYAYNNERKNKALYTDRAVYSPSVMFEKDGNTAYCDIITCACPNKKAALRYGMATEEENSRILKSRIRFVKDVAEDQNVDCLILGAFGCGAFGQNPEEVAPIMKDVFKKTSVKVIIMAVPGNDVNKKIFRETFI